MWRWGRQLTHYKVKGHWDSFKKLLDSTSPWEEEIHPEFLNLFNHNAPFTGGRGGAVLVCASTEKSAKRSQNHIHDHQTQLKHQTSKQQVKKKKHEVRIPPFTQQHVHRQRLCWQHRSTDFKTASLAFVCWSSKFCLERDKITLHILLYAI